MAVALGTSDLPDSLPRSQFERQPPFGYYDALPHCAAATGRLIGIAAPPTPSGICVHTVALRLGQAWAGSCSRKTERVEKVFATAVKTSFAGKAVGMHSASSISRSGPRLAPVAPSSISVKGLAAPDRTQEELWVSIGGGLGTATGRSDLVRLALPRIVEEAPEARSPMSGASATGGLTAPRRAPERQSNGQDQDSGVDGQVRRAAVV